MVDKATEVLRHRRKVPFDKANDFAINTPDQLIAQFEAITGRERDRAQTVCARVARHDAGTAPGVLVCSDDLPSTPAPLLRP